VYFKSESQGYYETFSVHKALQFLNVKRSSSVSLKYMIFKDNSREYWCFSIFHKLENYGGIEIWFLYSQNFTNSHFHFSVIVESVIVDVNLRFPGPVFHSPSTQYLLALCSGANVAPITKDVLPTNFEIYTIFWHIELSLSHNYTTIKTGYEFRNGNIFAHSKP
jgi:hypothetical protein